MCLHSVGWLLGAGCFKNASLICLVIGANWCLTLLSTQAQCSKKISAEAIRLPDAPLRSCTKSLPLVKVYHKAKPKSRAGKRDCFLQDAAKNLRSIFFFFFCSEFCHTLKWKVEVNFNPPNCYSWIWDQVLKGFYSVIWTSIRI